MQNNFEMQNWILTPAVKLPIQKTKDGWDSRPYLWPSVDTGLLFP